MSIRKTIAAICLFAILCIMIQPVMAAEANLTTDTSLNYYNIGEQRLNAGDKEGALHYFDLALAENTSVFQTTPAIFYMFNDKSAALVELGRYNEAIDAANTGLTYQSVNKDPDENFVFQNMWVNKGLAFYNLGRYQDANDAFDQAIAINSTRSMDWKHKGDALNKLNRYQDAIDAYNKAISLNPNNSYAKEALTTLQQKGPSIFPFQTIIIVIIVVVVIGGGAAFYFIKRKKSVDSSDKKNSKK
ncbi:MAG: tetratricopeptide repeat protein [Methanoregulaceae archaeon]